MAIDPSANSLEKPSDLGTGKAASASRWKLELKLADKRESDWRKKATDIYKLYTPDAPAANSFNILWTNTETLRQSVYNSLPQPDARRRYNDEDPLGKAVGEVMTRALEFAQDTYDFDGAMKGDVLSMLLAGRGLSRVRYVPDIRAVDSGVQAPADAPLQAADTYEEIAWEQVICERVQYNEFRILCAAKTWDAVTAIGFMHKFTRDDCIDKFGEEVGNAISMDSADDEDVKKSDDCADLFKTAEVWEIWDKDAKKVHFVCKTYPTILKSQDDPLELSAFFPVPRPLYAIENDQTLIPAALYTQYEQQAKELNRVSTRISKLTDALRVRGVYDATLTELANLMKQEDNNMVPAQNVVALAERGGLDKFIWMMPIDVAAAVLKELYIQRDACKQIIYEITGIADIMRSATDPNETFGAQKIKTQWGTQRLQRMQREVQRYIRDLIRLKAEIIAEKFQMETLEQMTLIKLPHQAELDQKKQQLMQQAQQAAQQAQMQGKPPPPPPPELQQPMPISWEKVMEAMKGDATRTYRIDIETDSTLSATQDSDMQGLKEVLTACAQILAGFGPAVQQGAMPVEVVKELMLAVVRRAKMGTAVEDAFEKMKQPPPPPDPEAGKAEAQMKIEQGKAQVAMQMKQQELQLQDQQHQREQQYQAQADQRAAELDAQVEAHKQQVQAQENAHQQQLEAQRAQLEQQNAMAMQQMQQQADERMAAMEQQFQLMMARENNAAKLEVAELASATTLQSAQVSAAKDAEKE